MSILTAFIFTFIGYFLIDYLLLKRTKKFKIDEFKFLKKRFNYSKNFIETKNIQITFSILNATIMATVCSVILYCNFNYFISIPLAFILILMLIYSIYGIYGNILKKIDNNKK